MKNDSSTQTLETLLDEVDDLLRCASATAYESADALSGSQRDHAFSVFHLIKVARGKVEQISQHQVSGPTR
ncbi:hypothetical protein ABQX22_18475 [Xanthomonas sp. WHRI 1810A]|uniref:DUF6124 family protein n=1 Tax=Xanthomonas sp. WHRI 1810A TaxID=3161565 RepID=UPI0032E86CDB